jgi:hypothetical protein
MVIVIWVLMSRLSFSSELTLDPIYLNLAGSSSRFDSHPPWGWILIKFCWHMHGFGFLLMIASSDMHIKSNLGIMIMQGLGSIFHFDK